MDSPDQKIPVRCDSCPYSAPGATSTPEEMPALGSPPSVSRHADILWSALGAFLGIGLCAWLSSRFLEPRDLTLIIGSFGASAVLIYGVIDSPLAQPRNLIGGHIISAFAGVAAWELLGGTLWLAAAAAVTAAIVAMLATGTAHPPGGATALIAVIGGSQIHDLGFLYPLMPVGAGAAIMLAVAVAVNKLAPGRSYPKSWF